MYSIRNIVEVTKIVKNYNLACLQSTHTYVCVSVFMRLFVALLDSSNKAIDDDYDNGYNGTSI